MELKDLITAKRPGETIDVALSEWTTLRQTGEILRMQVLPSEEIAFDDLFGRAEKEVARLAAERRFRGRLDMAALLRQERPGPAPRWFLYNPLTHCDTIHWSHESRIVFEAPRAGRARDRVALDLPNPFPRRTFYTASPILLPARIREQVLALKREKIDSYVLFEPRLVRSEALPEPRPIARPDPALVVEAGGEWFVVDLWDDPVVEDPRALNTLREFYASVKPPPWLAKP